MNQKFPDYFVFSRNMTMASKTFTKDLMIEEAFKLYDLVHNSDEEWINQHLNEDLVSNYALKKNQLIIKYSILLAIYGRHISQMREPVIEEHFSEFTSDGYQDTTMGGTLKKQNFHETCSKIIHSSIYNVMKNDNFYNLLCITDHAPQTVKIDLNNFSSVLLKFILGK